MPLQGEQIDTLDNPAIRPAARALSISTLSLHHFRNYDALRIEVTHKPVVLTGRNGAGKTNILEAMSLLTPGRGLRRAKIAEINRQSTDEPWAIAASVTGMQGDVKIGTGRDPEADPQTDKRLVRIDGKPARSQAELGRHLAMIWLTPQMEQLFNEGTSASRKFLDRLTYNFDTEHASRVNEYEFAMRERNRLLQSGSSDAVWLEALEQTMAETSCAIGAARIHTIANINHAIAQSPLSFPKAQLAITGAAENRLLEQATAVEVETELKAHWARSRRDDAAAGRTHTGAHRSEMQVTHIDKRMPAESCSTGEQKALLLSIIFAQARAGASWRQIVPVILLDEVVAHLDTSRRRELFEEIIHLGAQVWLTGTDNALFSGLSGEATFLQVDDGKITRI